MLRWVILAVVVVVLAAGSTLLMNLSTSPGTSWNLPVTPAKAGPMPKAVVEGELTHEFGEMGQQQTGKKSWKLTNEGDADLQIWKGTSTCMCTVAKLQKEGDKLTLKPGESTDIDIEWKTNFVTGDFHKGANIETNDPDHPTFPLFVHGKINPPVVVIPGDTIDLGAINSDEPKTVFVAVYSPDRPETKITEINTSKPDYFKTDVESMSASELESGGLKAGNKINLHVQPGFPLGTMREEIVIHTDHPLRPEIKLTVVGSVSGPISVVPDRLRMVTVKSKEGASGEVRLLVRGGKEAHFDVAQKPEKLEVSVEPIDPVGAKGRYLMKVSVPKGTAPGLIDGEILLKSDLPGVAELKVPVSFLVGAN
ncbi:DUF1573 domain-containing protein [Planctomyces sp. SH-PL62]|uniref:DUF1573 domain-containing protein n=1 Tax=Planctomyces sp. SH-PL62 TaxID=1636152 RepID=UPI00078CD00E|nr:DUF1573 domain-containing protein [Planctomyces sp. SH-PL62]AMV36577.1 hypothetical protein VT85_04035 [Planctomyces sp. SH-PL62]